VRLDGGELVLLLRKLTTSAIAVAPAKTRASGRTSSPSSASRATVSPKLNQISLGRSVGRSGSSELTMSDPPAPLVAAPTGDGRSGAATWSRVRPEAIW
jgi:hypothetical protein